MKTTSFITAKIFLTFFAFLLAINGAHAAFTTNADLAIGKSTSSSTVTVGQPVTFTLNFTNNGPSFVFSPVTVFEQVPSGFAYVTNTGGGSYNSGANTWTVTPGASGNVTSINVTFVPNQAGFYSNTVFFLPPAGVSDSNSLNNTSSVPVMVLSNSLITIKCPTNISTVATGSNGATVFYSVTASGGCSPPPFLVANPPSGSTFPIGTTLVTVHASDTCGNSNSCSFNITVTPPPITILCPSNITTAATGSNGATVFFTASASGSCNPVYLTAVPPSGSTFPFGTSLVTVTASDSCGTTTNYSFYVTVTNSPIYINCPTNVTTTASSSNGATVFYSVTASGGCNPPPFLSATPPSGSTFPIGTTLVTATASDSCGTTTNCSFYVTVLAPPVSLNCPSNIVTTATTTNGAIVFYSASASGGCNPPPFLTATPPSGSTFPIGNTSVMVTASDSCGTSTNCSFTVTVVSTNTPVADLMVTKTVNSNTVVQGQQVVFTVVLKNSGTIPVTNTTITVQDCLPAGFTYVTDSTYGNSSNGVFSPGTCHWDYTAGLLPGASTTLTVTAQATGLGSYTNTAVVSTPAGYTETNLINNTSSVPVTIVYPSADISIVKTVSPNAIKLGQQLTFTITLGNLGPNVISNFFTVTDCLPAGLVYVTDSTVGNSSNGTYSPGTCWWNWSGNLPVGGSAVLTITAQATNTGLFTNTASVGVPFGVTDTNLSNNTSSVTFSVTNTVVDLQITKTVNTNQVLLGQNAIFTLTLSNAGPATLTNIVSVNDLLPAGLQYVSDNGTGYSGNGVYSSGSGIWTVVPGASGASKSINITATVTNIGLITNVASINVPSQVVDPNYGNNTNSVIVTGIAPTTDLKITKTATTNLLQVGQTVTFTLTLSNLGPNNVISPVTVSDCVPPGFAYVSDTGSGGANGTYSPGTCLWTLPSGIVTNSGLTIQITLRATNTVCITNTAAIMSSSGFSDPNTNNNSASVTACVNPLYNVCGFVKNCTTNGSPLQMVTVNLSGPTNLTLMTDTNGFYCFSNLLNGIYTVKPTQNGNTFTPTNATAAVSNATVNLPVFTGSTPLITGSVTYGTNGAPITNTPVRITGPLTITIRTDTNGNFTFTNTAPGTYTVTPLPTNGYVFVPTNKVVTLTATNCSTNITFISTNRTVTLVAMELTQVIQDWSNSVALIAAKKTVLRAHLQLPTNNVPPVLVQGARLYGSNAGGALPGSPLSPANTNGQLLVSTTNASSVRGAWTNALNFELPASWTAAGNITLQFVWSNNVKLVINCPAPAGSSNGIVNSTFTTAPALPVRYYGWNFTNGAAVKTVKNEVFTNLGAVLTAIYPVPDVTRDLAQYVGPSILDVPGTIPAVLVAAPFKFKFGVWTIYYSNTKLQTTRLLDRLQGSFGSGVSNVVYYGALADNSPDTLGVANMFLTEGNTNISRQELLIASGFIGTSTYGKDYRQSHSHEIGHTLGRPHDVFATGRGACSEYGPTNAVYPLFQTSTGSFTNKPAIGPMTNGTNALIYGLDTSALRDNLHDPVASPFIYFDIMSYCSADPLDEWISPFTYGAIKGNIATNFNTVTPPVVIPQKTFLLVRGVVDPTVTNGFIQKLLTFTATNAPTPPAPGRYWLNIYGALSNLVGRVSFNPDQFENDDESGGSTETVDAYMIPIEIDSTNITSISITDTTNGTTIGSMTGSPHSPSVSSVNLTTTGGGSFIGLGNLIINWFGSDLDGDPLSYTVQYSADGGGTWLTLNPEFNGSTYTVDSTTLHPTTQGLIRIIATDGFNSSAPAYSTLFTIVAHPPVVTIYDPVFGQIYSADQQISFDVGAVDQTDGVLDGGSVQWVSSRNGILGYGSKLSIEADLLTPGLHTITAYAFASSGLTGSNSVPIYVLQQMPPQLSINYTGKTTNLVQLTWDSSVTNYSLEKTPSLLPANWQTLTNVPVVWGDTQSVTVTNLGTLFFRLRMQ